ncbi:MAG: hypothetical protein E7402_04900 [Ruminococcaceae bacterium]|nr:hypothetical protein [Oscillospiraceae bacterium]
MDLIPISGTDAGPVPAAAEKVSSPSINSISQNAENYNPQGEEILGEAIPQSVPQAASSRGQAGITQESRAAGIGTVKADAETKTKVNALGKKLGRKVIWYNAETDPDNAFARGYYDGEDNIHINEYAKDPGAVIFGHEMFHSLPDDVRGELIDFVRKNTQETRSFAAYRAELQQEYIKRYAAEGRTFDPDTDFWEEYTAETMETFFADEAFVNTLVRENRSLAQRILETIRELIAKIFGTPKSYTGLASDAAISGGLTDATLRKAEQMLAKALGEQIESSTYADGFRFTETETMPLEINTKKEYNRNNKKFALYNEEWHTDLNKREMAEVLKWLRQDIKTSNNAITNTANWYRGRLNGQSIFVIYSTRHIENPTILYEVKGAQGEYELNILKMILEDIDNGTGYDRQSTVVNEVLSGGWMRQSNSMGNSNGIVGRGRSIANATILQGQSSKRKPRPAFRAVIKNLFKEELNNGKRYALAHDGKERSAFYDSLQEAETVEDAVKQMVEDNIDLFTYEPITNEETMVKAVHEVMAEPDKEALHFLGLNKGAATREDIAKGFVLMKYLSIGKCERISCRNCEIESISFL